MWQKVWTTLRNPTFWNVIFAGLLTFFTYQLVKVSTKTNETSKATQRAYLNFSGVNAVGKNVSDDKKTWVSEELVLNWFNTGDTPARRAITAGGYQPWPHELPNGFDFPDSSGNLPISLGPKEVSGSVHINVPIKDFSDQIANKARLYFWGWIVYDDAFSGDPNRLTEFCVELNRVLLVHPEKDISDPTNDINWGVVKCKEHNCFDTDCQDYQARVDTARPKKTQ